MSIGRYLVMVRCDTLVDELDSFADKAQAERERDAIVGKPLKYPVYTNGIIIDWEEVGTISGSWVVDRGEHVQ